MFSMRISHIIASLAVLTSLLIAPLACDQAKPKPEGLRTGKALERGLASSQPANADDLTETMVRRNLTTQSTSTLASDTLPKRPANSIGAAVLEVNNETISANDVLRRAWPELVGAAKSADPHRFGEKCDTILYITTYDLVSEILLYQEISQRIGDEQKPAVEKAVDKALQDRIISQGGGSKIRLEKKLARHGGTIETLKKEIERQLLTQHYMKEKITPMIIITRDDLWEYYRQHRDDYESPGRAKLAIIEIDPERIAQDDWSAMTDDQRRVAMAEATRRTKELQKRFDAGDDFSALAKKYSTANSAKLGGNVGWITQGSFKNQVIEQAAFAVPVGKPSPPIVIDNRTFFVKVLEREDPNVVPFSQAQSTIYPLIEKDRYRDLVNRHIDRLRNKAHIGPIIPFVQAVISRLPSQAELKADDN